MERAGRIVGYNETRDNIRKRFRMTLTSGDFAAPDIITENLSSSGSIKPEIGSIVQVIVTKDIDASFIGILKEFCEIYHFNPDTGLEETLHYRWPVITKPDGTEYVPDTNQPMDLWWVTESAGAEC